MVFIMDASKPDIVKEPSSYKEENKGFIDHATAHECIHNFTIIVASTRGGKLKVVIVTVLPPRSVYTGGNSESSFRVGPPASSGGQTAESLQSKNPHRLGTSLGLLCYLGTGRAIRSIGGEGKKRWNLGLTAVTATSMTGQVNTIFLTFCKAVWLLRKEANPSSRLCIHKACL